MTHQEIIFKVKETIKKHDPRARIILFGSRARGNFNTGSDWDFLILTSFQIDEKLKKQIRTSLIDTELDAEEVISTLIYSQNQWKDYKLTQLYKNITNEGVEV